MAHRLVLYSLGAAAKGGPQTMTAMLALRTASVAPVRLQASRHFAQAAVQQQLPAERKTPPTAAVASKASNSASSALFTSASPPHTLNGAAKSTTAAPEVESAATTVASATSVEDDLDGIYILPHFHQKPTSQSEYGNTLEPANFRLPHPVWSRSQLEDNQLHLYKPKNFIDWAAYGTVKTLRVAYDLLTGYLYGWQDEACMLRRIIFLETIAGVPGMVGAMVRHLNSLRRMERDYGWIHTLLEEAENERMHLMTAMLLRKPSTWIRLSVLCAQGAFLSWYTIMYLLSPRYCHRFVGYLEEQAFVTYTTLVEKIDRGELPGFDVPAPPAARAYYHFPEGTKLRDIFLAMRADENHHREVNHTFADMDPNHPNPFPPGF